MNKAKILALTIALVAIVGLLIGCTPDKLEGSLVGNVPPEIHFTNLPLGDSVYTSNARIYWYGEDEDGRVVSYYYYVVQASQVGGDPENYINTVLDTTSIADWTSTQDTYVEVRLIASYNETDTIPQYLFVKCQDDGGAFSTSTIYLFLSRVNRLPETYLKVVPGLDTLGLVHPVWCLPDTNAIWDGLDFAWEGKDTLDFPDNPPDFEYEWKIFGPYDTSFYDANLLSIDLTIADTSSDLLLVASCADNDDGYIRTDDGSVIGDCENTWVFDKDVTILNLPTGCYIFTVRVRDDALVPDTSAAWGTFVSYMPVWESDPDSARDVLLLRATQFRQIPSTSLRGYPNATDTAGTANYPDSVLNFYNQMLMGAGYDELDSTDIFGDTGQNALPPESFPTIADLARHRMIIFDDMDYNIQELQESQLFTGPLADYLVIGGKVWVIGRQSFIPGSFGSAGYLDFAAQSPAYLYFDLSGATYAQRNLSGDSAEFIGAGSVNDDYADLMIDPSRTAQMQQHGVNKVEVLVRSSNASSTIFTYRAANPDTMEQFQFAPCAVRFYPNHHVFKSSYFSFPLYMMDNSSGAVQQTFTNMLTWFLED